MKELTMEDAIDHANRSILISTTLEEDAPDKTIVNKIAQECLTEGDYYNAGKLYTKIGNNSGIHKAGERALKVKSYWDAYLLLRTAGQTTKEEIIKKTLEKAVQEEDDTIIKYITEAELWGDVKRGFDEMCEHFAPGVGRPTTYNLAETIKTIHPLLDKYDCAIGVAKGGLFSSHIWTILGGEVYIVQPQRMTDKNGNTTGIAKFRWATKERPPKGARILVIENDLSTGKTLERVAKALSYYNPTKIGVCFNDNIIGEDQIRCGGSPASNIPKAYTAVYAPNLVTYENYMNGFFALQKAMASKQNP